jgi:hypothetical protein
MTNKTYTDLAALIKGLAGVYSFSTNEDTAILAFVNRRLYQAYNASPVWPRYMKVEARPANDGLVTRTYTPASRNISSATRSGATVTVVTTAAVTFVAGMDVTVASVTYSTTNPNGTYKVASVSTTTIDNDTFTYELDSGTSTETYGGSGTVIAVAVDEIGDFQCIYSGNPNANAAGYPINWYETYEGARLTGDHDGLEGYYLAYKKVWPGPYTSSATDIPGEFFEYAAHAAFSDFLLSDGQHDKARAESNAAEAYIGLEMLKSSQSRNINRFYSQTRTHASTQAR